MVPLSTYMEDDLLLEKSKVTLPRVSPEGGAIDEPNFVGIKTPP